MTAPAPRPTAPVAFPGSALKAASPAAEGEPVGARHRRRPPFARRGIPVRTGGFTLLELLIALILIAFVSSIAIPAYFDRDEITLENAAVLLARDLRSAQNRAAYLGEPIEFSFDSTLPGYRVWSPGQSFAADPSSYERDYERDAVFEGVALSATGFNDSGALTYEPTGKAQTAGKVTLRYGGHVRIVEIEAPSGRIVIHNTSSDWRDRGFDT